MFGIGTTELIIVGIVAVILFGGRLPSVARSLGRSLNEFKRGMRDVEKDVHDAIYSEPAGHIQDHSTRAEPQDDAHRETADTHGN
jgi:sec-independent protein translocase protein TatA